MSRPRKGTKGCQAATAKWKATMEAKYGGADGVRKRLSEMGRKGGKASNTGGFASLVVGSDGLTGHQRAKIAGKKGGTISRREPATHPRKDKGIPRKHLNADSNFIEYVEPKKTWKWPWSK